MNNSLSERYGTPNDDTALVDRAVQLLPVIGASLYSGISHLGHTYRLTPAQVKVLLLLGSHEQLTVGEIAASLAVSMPTASELVDRLVDAGHLVRTTDPADRRKVLVAATPDARRIGVELRALREEQVRHALNQLTPEEQRCFVPSLEALVVGLTRGTGTMPTCVGEPASDREPGSVPLGAETRT